MRPRFYLPLKTIEAVERIHVASEEFNHRSPQAAALASPLFHKRVKPSAKIYRRKARKGGAE